MRWNYPSPAPQDFLSKFPDIDPVISQLLWNRGLVERRDADVFFQTDWNRHVHDPFLFRDMERAVGRIYQAIEHKEHITILADYDADGITSGTVLYETLNAIGAKDVSIYIPDRFTEGYGIKAHVIEGCASDGVTLAISVDVGITAHDALEKARAYGIDVVICDHHHAHETLPPAYAILHPHLPGEPYPFKDLSGVGVTYKLAQALLRKSKVSAKGGSSSGGKSQKSKVSGSDFDSFEKWLLDLVAIGTVADVVPILGENRVFVKYGLVVLNKTKRVGLRELILKAGLRLGSMSEESTSLSTRNIGWHIGPRINAASRMEHGKLAFQLLIEPDGQRAKELAESLDSANKDRQELTAKIVQEARELADSQEHACVLASSGWPSTVCGLVAGRLAEELSMPVFLLEQKQAASANLVGAGRDLPLRTEGIQESNLAENIYEGSGRSVDGIDLMEILDSCKDILSRYGGHPMACGLAIEGERNLNEFRKRASDYVAAHLPEGYEKTIHLEVKALFSDITEAFYAQLQRFEPHGEKNPKPLFGFEKIRVVQLSRMGKEANHLRIMGEQGGVIMKLMWFNVPQSSISSIGEGDILDIAGEIELSEWNGNREVFVKVKDVKLIVTSGMIEFAATPMFSL